MAAGVGATKNSRAVYMDALRVAVDGEVKEVYRALVAVDGVARQVWPPSDLPDPDDVPDPTPPEVDIVYPYDVATSPDEAVAWLRVNASTGRVRWRRNDDIEGQAYANPPPQAGEYLVQMQTVSGTIDGDTTDSWIDPTTDSPLNWQVSNDSDDSSVVTAEGLLRVARNDGFGSPEPGTEEQVAVSFRAEVVGTIANPGFSFTADSWALSDTAIGADAGVSVRVAFTPFLNVGTVRGYEGAGNTNDPTFTEEYGNPTTGAERITASLIVGDEGWFTGDVFDTPIALSYVSGKLGANWTLEASPITSRSAVLELTISDGAGTDVTKQITMDIEALETDPDDTDIIDPPPDPDPESDILAGGIWSGTAIDNSRASLTFTMKRDGTATLVDQDGNSIQGWPKIWNDEAVLNGGTGDINAERFSCRIRKNTNPPGWAINNFAPNGTGNPPFGQWVLCDDEPSWDLIVLDTDFNPIKQGWWFIDIRRNWDVPGVFESAEIRFNVNIEGIDVVVPPGIDPDDPDPPIGPPIEPDPP